MATAKELEKFMQLVWSNAIAAGRGNKPMIIMDWQREMIETLAKQTEKTKYVSRPRRLGTSYVQQQVREAMMKLQLNAVKKLVAKQRKKRALTCEERHARRYPAMQLHPDICPKHLAFWKATPKTKHYLRSANYGKGRVLFTTKEGGLWQKWPWNWVPEPETLESWRLLGSMPSFIVSYNKMPIVHNKKSAHQGFYIHSILLDGRRWDCINGFTN